ncbi:MAG: MSCRAMM family protein [Mycoplasmatales bacterium]
MKIKLKYASLLALLIFLLIIPSININAKTLIDEFKILDVKQRFGQLSANVPTNNIDEPVPTTEQLDFVKNEPLVKSKIMPKAEMLEVKSFYHPKLRLEWYTGGSPRGLISYYIVDSKIVFCIEPTKPTDHYATKQLEKNSRFSTFSSTQKNKLAQIVSYGLARYAQTKNSEYLYGAQLLIWETTNPTIVKLSKNNTMKKYTDEIRNLVTTHQKIPSFMSTGTPIKTKLNWHNERKQYEVELTDSNQVWDNRFKQTGKFGDYEITAIGPNKIRVSTKNFQAQTSQLITVKYTSYPMQPSVFFEANQDLARVTTPDISAKMQFEVNHTLGEIELKKQFNSTSTGLFNANQTHNATFEIRNDQNEQISTVVVGLDGESSKVVKNLRAGVYQIKEVASSVSADYKLDQTVYSCVISPGERCKLNNGQPIINKRKQGSLKLFKKAEYADGTVKALGNTKFKLKTQAGEIIGTYITNQAGEIVVNNLDVGHYLIAEEQAPPDFMLDRTVYKVEVIADKQVVVNRGQPLINKQFKAGFKLQKNDENQMPVANVSFRLTGKTKSGKIFKKDYFTNSSGEISENSLELGTYQIEEIKTNDLLVNEHFFEQFNLQENDELFQVNKGKPIINKFKKWEVTVKKVAKKKAKEELTIGLADAVFSLVVDENNDQKISAEERIKPVETFKTNNLGIGKSKSNRLDNKRYYLVEQIAPNGYRVDNKAIELKLDQTKANQNIQVVVENQPIENKIEILKIDGATKKPLSGAVLELKTTSNSKVASWTTTKTAYVLNLPFGSYELCEVSSPEGYSKNPDCKRVEVKNDFEQQKISFENERKKQIEQVLSTGFTKHHLLFISITSCGFLVLMLMIRFKINKRKQQKNLWKNNK